jgi:hypothetical protein
MRSRDITRAFTVRRQPAAHLRRGISFGECGVHPRVAAREDHTFGTSTAARRSDSCRQGAGDHRIDRPPRPHRASLFERQAAQLGPHTSLLPLHEPTVHCRSRRPKGRCRQLPPSTPRSGHENDRSQYLTVPIPTPTTALRTHRGRRHHLLEQLPQLIRHQVLNDPHRHRLSRDRNEMTQKSAGAPIRRPDLVAGRHSAAHSCLKQDNRLHGGRSARTSNTPWRASSQVGQT